MIAAISWLLVAPAGVVALLAYLDASGRSDLQIEATFNFSFPNEPVLLAADAGTPEQRRQVEPYKQVSTTVTINQHQPVRRQEPRRAHRTRRTAWHRQSIAPVLTRMPVRILAQGAYDAYADERKVRLGIEPPATAA
ncbi:hypothetical protein ACFV2N_38465 [Streptomyces sp. NPDC059680]|uniref:hypothetical protein n=1 Tax=Streptomyces sp. NPDC059680 TaxID=3346904 RepID=UPI00369D19F1